jgi:predicted DNA-binding protein (MmcQ/YjbR family)
LRRGLIQSVLARAPCFDIARVIHANAGRILMTPEQFNQFCGSLPHTTHVVQFGGADVWKIGGKLFAAMWDASHKNGGVTFKPSPIGYEVLQTRPGLRPAPYLASRGIKWIQRYSEESMSDNELKEYLKQSYVVVREALPRKVRESLQLPE